MSSNLTVSAKIGEIVNTKPIWSFRAKSCKVTKSGSLTVEDSRSTVDIGGKDKRTLSSAARKVIKKLLKKKTRNLQLDKVPYSGL